MSRNFLSEIVARKRQVMEIFRANSPIDRLQAQAIEVRKNAATHRLRQALGSASPAVKIIAEFKRASPSGGKIRSDLSPADVARYYENGGACAISVLTNEEYFGGSLEDLSAVRTGTHLPVLRKDFIIDAIQVYEAAIAGADAILLIVAALDDASLGKLLNLTEDELGLDALIEVHTSDELRRALTTGAKIIGVNNRNLQTLEVSIRTSEQLIAGALKDTVMISESGLRDPEQLRWLRALGFHGFLIGEHLMRAKNPATALRDLLAAANDQQIVSLENSRI
jgi:indole-3-glycerol phosphate synthase